MQNKQIEYTSQQEVYCDGNNSAAILLNDNLKFLGHPKVYLKFSNLKETITCPYCNKIFAYKNNNL